MEQEKEGVRLNKWISEAGICSRREADRLIQAGRVTVDGRRAETGTRVQRGQRVQVDGKAASREKETILLAVNKPAGVVSATQDKKEKTVLSLMENPRKDLFPAGRLDKDTEGLLLLTNDGGFAHKILSPKKHVDKTYFARIQGRVTQADIESFAEGIDIGEKKRTLPGKLKILSSGEVSEIELTIQEGKFHQVKRMFHAVGKQVLYLKRIQMGNLVLDQTLKPGEYRELTEEEKEQLC